MLIHMLPAVDQSIKYLLVADENRYDFFPLKIGRGLTVDEEGYAPRTHFPSVCRATVAANPVP